MTPQFWKQIQPQLHTFISEQLAGYTALELYESLSARKWWTEQPLDMLYLTYDGETLPIKSWLVVCRAMVGDQIEEIFTESLQNRIHDVVAYEWAMRQRELEEDYENEVKEEAA